jgi:hypothetical protein
MRQQIISGQELNLNSSQGVIVRTVAEVMGDVVLVCRKEEYKRARREGRVPLSIGFRVSDIAVRGA